MQKGYAGKCKKCESNNVMNRGRRAGSHDAGITWQEISLRTADRNKFEYTTEDEIVLLDDSTTVFEKAIALRRSYFAVRAALFARQIRSSFLLGDKDVDQWMIDNPNIERVSEITASLRDEILEFGKIHPEWDWDE
jgi:hypothetical protein